MSDEIQPETVTQVVTGAWGDALGETGVKRAFLVALVGVMTVPFAPLWGLLRAFEILGLYKTGEGWLP